MREEWRRWKDLVVASGIVLFLIASRAGGQVDVSFLPGDGSGMESALVALEKSREALLDAREAIDAALKEVDLAMVSLEASSPRSRRREEPGLAEAPPRPSVEKAPRRPSIDELREAGEKALAWGRGVAGEMAMKAWHTWVAPRREEGAPAPAVARSEGEVRPAPAVVSGGGAGTGTGTGTGEGTGTGSESPEALGAPVEALPPEKKAVLPAP